MAKIVIYMAVVVWCIATFPSVWKKYKKEKNLANRFEIFARILMISAGIILSICEVIGK